MQNKLYKKCKYEYYSLTSWHRITLDGLTCHYNLLKQKDIFFAESFTFRNHHKECCQVLTQCLFPFKYKMEGTRPITQFSKGFYLATVGAVVVFVDPFNYTIDNHPSPNTGWFSGIQMKTVIAMQIYLKCNEVNFKNLDWMFVTPKPIQTERLLFVNIFKSLLSFVQRFLEKNFAKLKQLCFQSPLGWGNNNSEFQIIFDHLDIFNFLFLLYRKILINEFIWTSCQLI